MSEFLRSRAFLAIPIFVVIVIGLDFFLTITWLEYWAEVLRTFAVIITNVAMGLGVINLLMTHGKNIQGKKDQWMYSIVALGSFAIVFLLGLMGTESSGYKWQFAHVYTTLQQTMYASTGFFIASSAYRAFRARNIDATLLLVAGIITMLRNAPIGEVIFFGFPVLGDWLMSVGQMPAYRTFMLITGFGFLFYGLRAIFGKERGFYGGSQ